MQGREEKGGQELMNRFAILISSWSGGLEGYLSLSEQSMQTTVCACAKD